MLNYIARDCKHTLIYMHYSTIHTSVAMHLCCKADIKALF